MTNYVLPSILVATALFAGAFALMPIDEAQAVHTTIQGTQMTQADFNSVADLSGTDTVCDSDAAFVVMILVSAPAADGDTLTISDGTVTLTMTGDVFASGPGSDGFGGQGYSATIAAAAADTITIGGAGDAANEAYVSLVTTSGATANCA